MLPLLRASYLFAVCCCCRVLLLCVAVFAWEFLLCLVFAVVLLFASLCAVVVVFGVGMFFSFLFFGLLSVVRCWRCLVKPCGVVCCCLCFAVCSRFLLIGCCFWSYLFVVHCLQRVTVRLFCCVV